MAGRSDRIVNLDIDLVRAFVTVVEAGSATQAAERLGRTQPAISMQIKRLEERLDADLLAPSRPGRPLRLTEHGERIIVLARHFLQINDKIVAEVTSDDSVVGEVRLGAPEEFAAIHLADVLSSFARSHPKVAVTVTCDLSMSLIEGFRQGSFDLVLIKTELNAPFDGETAWRVPLVWVAANPELVDGKGPVSLCVRPSPCLLRKRAITVLEGAGRRMRVGYTSPSLVGLNAALRAGLGITVLPLETVPTDLAILPKGLLPPLDDLETRLLKPSSGLSRAGETFAQALLGALKADRRARTRAN